MSLLSSIAHRLTERVRAVRRMASRPRPADRDVGRLFEITFDLMGVASLDGTMLRVNPGIERVLGLAPEEVVGRRLVDIVHPDDREGTVAAFAGVLEAGQLSGFENRLSAADGSYSWLQWNLLAEADEGLVYGVARDVTEHRHAERELRGAQRELEGSREELRVLSDEQASLRRVAVLVAGGAASADVFEAIAREVAHVLRPRLVQILRLSGSAADGKPIGNPLGLPRAGAAARPPVGGRYDVSRPARASARSNGAGCASCA